MSRLPSGRFVLRIDAKLHQTLRHRAATRGLSLNAFCASLLSEHVKTIDNRPAPLVAPESAPLATDIERVFGGSLVGIVLFGSRARGDATAGSDTDLLVVLEPGVPLRRDLYTRWDEELPRDASPHFVHLPAGIEEAGSLWLEASIDGVVLKDTRGKIAGFLARIRRGIAEGSVVRRTANGHPYWIRAIGGSADAE